MIRSVLYHLSLQRLRRQQEHSCSTIGGQSYFAVQTMESRKSSGGYNNAKEPYQLPNLARIKSKKSSMSDVDFTLSKPIFRRAKYDVFGGESESLSYSSATDRQSLFSLLMLIL